MIIWSISLIKGNCSSLSAETWHKELKLAVVPKKVSKRIISLREVLTKRSQDWVFCQACDNLFNETRASCTPVKYVKISVGGGGRKLKSTLPYPTLPYPTLPYPTLPHFPPHHSFPYFITFTDHQWSEMDKSIDLTIFVWSLDNMRYEGKYKSGTVVDNWPVIVG